MKRQDVHVMVPSNRRWLYYSESYRHANLHRLSSVSPPTMEQTRIQRAAWIAVTVFHLFMHIKAAHSLCVFSSSCCLFRLRPSEKTLTEAAPAVPAFWRSSSSRQTAQDSGTHREAHSTDSTGNEKGTSTVQEKASVRCGSGLLLAACYLSLACGQSSGGSRNTDTGEKATTRMQRSRSSVGWSECNNGVSAGWSACSVPLRCPSRPFVRARFACLPPADRPTALCTSPTPSCTSLYFHLANYRPSVH
jgi:hypothetical protein